MIAMSSIQTLLRQTRRCDLVMRCSTSLHDTPQLSLDVITSAVGSLDDLEAEMSKWDVTVSPSLVTQVIDYCTATFDSKNSIASRRLRRFFSWCQHQNAGIGDEVFNHAIQAFAKMRDLTSMSLTISDLQKQARIMTPETFSLVVETLVKLDKEEEAIQLFRSLNSKDQLLQYYHENERGCSSGLLTLVHSLCAKGHVAKARGTVWKHMRELLTSEGSATSIIHRSILHGWCIHGNVKEARRVMADKKSLGIRPSLATYNDLLLCICKRNVKFNPSGLVPEATNLMIEMKSSGVPPTTTSFNILLSCLSKVRRVKEAYRILYSMRQGEAGCSPDWISFYIVVRVLYLTARFTRGNRLVDEMIMEGLLPSQSFYHNLIGLLCGLEKVDLALVMLQKMNKYSEQSSGKTYDILIDKLGRSGQFDKAKCLWNEAIQKGIILQCSRDLLDPSKIVVFRPTTSMSRKVQRQYRNTVARQKFVPWPIEIRFCETYLKIKQSRPSLKYWFKARGKLSDDPALHRCMVAYASDLIFSGVSLSPHTLRGVKAASLSLDHSMWFHKPVKADDWLLYVIESPVASGGRGFCTRKMFNRKGELVVSLTQEGVKL